MKKYSLVLLLILLSLVSCDKKQEPKVGFKNDEIVEFEYGVYRTDEEIIAAIIDNDKSEFDRIELSEIDFNVVTSKSIFDPSLGFDRNTAPTKDLEVTAYIGEHTQVFTKKYRVLDTQLPVIDGVKNLTVKKDSELDFNSFLSAYDEVNGNKVPLEIDIKGHFDTHSIGTYTVEVSTSDSNDNTVSREITVTVE